jgi:hypothetical protein
MEFRHTAYVMDQTRIEPAREDFESARGFDPSPSRLPQRSDRSGGPAGRQPDNQTCDTLHSLQNRCSERPSSKTGPGLSVGLAAF